MKLIKSKNANINYLAKVVEIKDFTPHPNADKLKCAHVDGYNIIVGLEENPGLYIYFPTSCEINGNLLSYANLYRHKERNANGEQTGFFEDNGRVKAIKLRGVLSEGFLLPANVFRDFLISSVNVELNEFQLNTEFDCVEHNGKEFWVCKKYIIKTSMGGLNSGKTTKPVKGYDKIDDTQFRFHYDTTLVKKEPWCIGKKDLISITEKIHGTSGISANVLCKKKSTLLDKIANLLLGKPWNTQHRYYDLIYASRTVIKNRYFNKNVSSGFYGVDIWKYAHDIVSPHLPSGYTAYYEIVGYLPTGAYIQKGYDYGCIPPKEGETYTPEKHFKVRIYRVTVTNADGVVHEFSAREVQQWCERVGLIPVKQLYYGLAEDLYPELLKDDSTSWSELFWERLSDDKNFFMECNSPSCNNKVPHEGLVIKKEDMIPHAWKLKCFNFLQGEAKELDAGEANIEDNN
jgi:tRNA-binding EMAP/Myf-like protein